MKGKQTGDYNKPENGDFCANLLHNLPGMSYRCHADGQWTMVFMSEGVRKLTGYGANDFIDNAVRLYNDIIHPEDRDRVKLHVNEVLHRESHLSFEYRIIDANNHIKWVWEQCVPVEGSDGTVYLDGIVLDITNRVHLNQALLLERQRLSRVVDSTADIIFEIDDKKRFVSVYGKGLEKIGMRSADFVDKTVLEMFGSEAGSNRHQAYTKALKGETVNYDWAHTRDGDTLHFSSSLSPITNVKGRVVGAVGIAREVTDQIRHQRHIEHLSYRDQLTGAYNRYYLYESIEREMSLADRYKDALSLITMDVDGFKRINDAHGHAIGDQALKDLTTAIKNMIRKSDLLFRTGGEEFLLVLPKTPHNAAMKLAERIRRALVSQRKDPYGTLTCSFGVAQRHPNEGFDAWWKRGDQAMYDAKHRGGDRVEAACEEENTTE